MTRTLRIVPLLGAGLRRTGRITDLLAALLVFAAIDASPARGQAPNLDARTYPSGWAMPVVPRSDNGATPTQVVPSSPLSGGAAATYLNWTSEQQGPGNVLGTDYRIYRDGIPIHLQPVAGPLPPAHYHEINLGPFTVPASLSMT